eukprot:1160672-Pelagomonas_calceolata.AAC.1
MQADNNAHPFSWARTKLGHAPETHHSSKHKIKGSCSSLHQQSVPGFSSLLAMHSTPWLKLRLQNTSQLNVLQQLRIPATGLCQPDCSQALDSAIA